MRVRDVLARLMACRTAALGGHLARCSGCGWSRPMYNGCGDRHCPTCQHQARAEWLQARLERLLPVGHFQVVFTLPADLRPWARTAPRVVYDALFTAAAHTLSELADSRLGGGERTDLGVLAVLHTWSNDLRFHPHIHAVVTAGGLRVGDASEPRWCPSRTRFLFPVRVLGALFRGKLLAALRAAWDAGTLPDPPGERFDLAAKVAWRKRWVVHVDPPTGRDPASLTKYLARYVRGVAISDHRIRAISGDSVTIQTRRGDVTLSGAAFVRRFSQHILPRRLHAVRYYGLYAPNQAFSRFVLAWRALRDAGATAADVPCRRLERPESRCPSCGGALTQAPIPGVASHRPRRMGRAREPP